MSEAAGAVRPLRVRFLRIAAFSLIAAGVSLTVFGGAWAPTVLDCLAGSTSGAWIELVVPFGPLVIVACGAALLPISRCQAHRVSSRRAIFPASRTTAVP